MRRHLLIAFVLLGGVLAQAGAPATAVVTGERHIKFNDGWRFAKEDPIHGEDPGLADAGWREVELPHDWAIEGPFDKKYNAQTGGLPIFGVAWYRKHFALPASAKGKSVSIEFDGAMSNARVFLNGTELGGRPYGYIGFSFDLTKLLKFGGDENVIAVRLAPEDQSSRWYPGAGIYRNVWLDVTEPVHVARWGTYVTTPVVTDARADVAVRTDVQNERTASARISLDTSILDASGKVVGRSRTELVVPPGGSLTSTETIAVTKPERWDVDRPYLYRVVSEVRDGARVADHYETPFGIRSIEFDRERGFVLNGRHLKMNGVCNHHDLGALGAAVNRRAIERQLQIMKSAGVNAIRTSHNPPSPELLEFADKLGLLVMDEAFDMWRMPKVRNGSAKYFDKWGETDIKDMVRRDRNHPSIVLWSIGNEIGEQGQTDGWKVAKLLVDAVRSEDRTRPITAGFNSLDAAIKNGLADQVDIPGFNYKPTRYQQVLDEHTKWIIVASETSSCVSSRGVYHLPLEKYQTDPSLQVTSYDIVAPPWAMPPDVEFDAQERLPNVLGEFVWTGFDYLGEPTPYGARNGSDWPSRSSYFGFVDLAGFPKDRFFLYQSKWTKQPMVHILPHWNWAGREGQPIPVFAYTNADAVELFLNGKSLGRKNRGSEPVEIPVGKNVSDTLKFKTKYRLLWQVPYEAGELKAVAYKEGKPAATDVIRTAGAPAQIRLVPDRTAIAADGEDLSFVTVRIEDKDGNFCPLADNLVKFKVDGAGRIAAVDNGNAATVEPFQADYRKAFNGLCLLIVRSRNGQAGRIQIGATSDGLRSAGTQLVTSPGAVASPQGVQTPAGPAPVGPTLAGQAPATVHRVEATYEDYLTGNAADAVTPTKGGLQLEGGGTDIDDAFRWLIAHAGGGDIVIIRASGADGYNPYIPTLGRVDSVESIVFKSREASFDKSVIRTIEHAEAVFIAGGDQSNYVKYWKGTPVEDTLHALAKRGVPIGGTSAGLAVLGQFSYSAMKDSVTAPQALTNPYDDKITLERAFLRMPNMAGIITDSHVGPRDRLGRTLVFLARIVTDGWAASARAMAVDQESAVLVETDGRATVVGKAPTYFIETTTKATVCKESTPLTMGGFTTYRVPPGGTFNLKTWSGTGGTAYVLSVDAGVVSSSIGKIY